MPYKDPIRQREAQLRLKKRNRDFVNNYKGLSNKQEHPEYLMGIHEIDNSTKGLLERIKPPKEIEVRTDRKQIAQGMIDA